jgi:ParB family transcriptional regulator, chromosome partitioning protein
MSSKSGSTKRGGIKAIPLRSSHSDDRVSDLMKEVGTGSEFDLAGEVLATNAELSKAPVPGHVAGRREVPAMPVATTTGMPQSVHELVAGQTYNLPLGLLTDSPRNARVHYIQEEIDDLVVELQANGQEVAAWGYIDEDRVRIVDGGKRLRAARAAGLESLRVDVNERPQSDKEIYKLSRKLNLKRSAQTCFDDAVRFRQMLDDGTFKDQEELGRELLEGASQTTVSQILSINKIPEKLIRLMREDAKKLCQTAFAVEVARHFREGEEVESSKVHAISEILRKVSEEDLSVKKMRELFESRMVGPKPRTQPTSITVKFGAADGSIKVYRSRGQVEFSIKGVPEDRLQELTERIQKAISEEAAK